MKRYNSYIEHLPIETFRALCYEYGKKVSYSRFSYFQSPGAITSSIGYIVSGCFRYACLNEETGKDHTIGFAFSGEFVGDYPACLYAPSSDLVIQALSPCEVILCPVEVLEEFFHSEMQYLMLARKLSDYLFFQIYLRYKDLYRYTPEERYLNLLRQHPDLLQLVPLKEIASFLQITPVHMSRIRKKQLLQEG